jgi:hypothetical protein
MDLYKTATRVCLDGTLQGTIASLRARLNDAGIEPASLGSRVIRLSAADNLHMKL